MSKQNYREPCDIALIYARLGQKEQAFAWLEEAYVDRDPELIELRMHPMYDGLRSDPRFEELVKRIGLDK